MSTTTSWIKAAKSTANGSCLEVRRHAGMIEVRDSKEHGKGPILRFTAAEFDAFLDGARNAEFDHLIAE